MITPEKIRDMAEVFLRAYHRSEYSIVDMTTGFVHLSRESKDNDDDYHICGTVACHAGHYLFQTYLDKRKEMALNGHLSLTTGVYDQNGVRPRSRIAGFSYSNGAQRMSEVLGFDEYSMLEKWAYDNPKIWGNPNGLDMFNNKRAFGLYEVDEDLTLLHIYTHWLGVADRLEKAND